MCDSGNLLSFCTPALSAMPSKYHFLLAFLCFSILFQPSAYAKKKKDEDKKELNLKLIFGSGTLNPKYVYGLNIIEGGYVSRGYNTILGASEIYKYSYTQEEPIDTLLTLKQVQGIPDDAYVDNYVVTPSANYILLETKREAIYRRSSKAETYIYSTRAQRAKAIAPGKKIMYPVVSPDESRVAYVFDNNLYIFNFKTNEETQVTTDGKLNSIINGAVDWVYEEEFSMSRGYEWSPSGKYIIYYKFDESLVPEYQFSVYDSLYPSQYKYKYPKAGQPSSKVDVHIYNTMTQKHNTIVTGSKNDQYIPRIGWSNTDSIAYFYRLNRAQNKLELLFVNPQYTKATSVYDEVSTEYIDIENELTFLPDNSFLLISDREGFKQIYHYNIEGRLKRYLTQAAYDVVDILGYDSSTNYVYYGAYEPTPLDVTLHRIRLDGTAESLVIKGASKGTTAAEASNDFKYFIVTSQADEVIPQTIIYSNDGQLVRLLEDNEQLRKTLTRYSIPKKQFIKLPGADGVELNGWIIMPPEMKKREKYPVLFTVYGGPGINSVRNSYAQGLDLWYRYLAQQGVVVVSVDNRGTAGRGAAFLKSTYKKLGQLESDDIIAAAKHIGSQNYADPDRIGIYGWSFGGYIAAMGITKGNDVFDLAVAVAPVTDWRYYDNVYTERYMGLPKENDSNYTTSSVMNYIDNYKQGDFLIIHGTFDDNVHPHNSYDLISQLIQANKPFDSEFYPDKNHSIYGGNTRLHLFTRITEFLRENL